MLLADLAATSAAVSATPQRSVKIGLLAACLRGLQPAEIPVAVAYLSGEIPQGAIGVGWAALSGLPPAEAAGATVPILAVHQALSQLQDTSGPGSQAVRRAGLVSLFSWLTRDEQRFLVGVLSGGLRQGALAGMMLEAVARAAGLPAADVRRAALVCADLAAVAEAALTGGRAALAAFHPTLLHPMVPMLAQSAASAQEAMERTGPAAAEWKFDGVRVQVHRAGDQVAVFTRNLADATARVPEVVAAVRALPGGDLILDGELIALGPTGRPRRFQDTMGRFGTRGAGRASRRGPGPALALTPYFFDCLHLEGQDLLDAPARERAAALTRALPAALLVPRVEAPGAAEAEAFLASAIAAGHEGILVKSLEAPYAAGRRGAAWVKVKRAQTLDLVVLAAEWGHGRRRGWLSNLHLGARDPAGGFVMLGKTFKGMTDEVLAWQTRALLALETNRDTLTVRVRPELVVEVAFDGLQQSSRYPGGLALRFARIRGYRNDKSAAHADTMETVRAIYDGGR